MIFFNKDNLQLKKCKTLDKFTAEDIENSKVVLIDNKYVKYYFNIIEEIRKSDNFKIYLKPIYIIKTVKKDIALDILNIIDGIYSYEDIINNNINYNEIDEINNKILKIKYTKMENLGLKILRFMYTRNSELIPFVNIKSIFGYSYNYIDIFFNNDSKNIFDILNLLFNKKLLDRKFKDKTHSCPNCYSSFLNFKEVCPKCNNINIEKKELIHHYKCAYIDIKDKFLQNNKLVCPKCNEQLEFIGKDYDTPSIIYHCNECNYSFQEPKILVSCFNCKNKYDVDNINTLIIYEYKLTGLGENAAIYGFDNLFNESIKFFLNIYSFDFFKDLLKIEIDRIRRYNKTTDSLLLLDIKEIEAIINNEEIIKEISNIIKKILRTTDIITIITNNLYGILLLETDIKSANIVIKRLQTEIIKLIKDNLHKIIDLPCKNIEINKSSKYEEVEQVWKNFNGR